MAKLERDRDAFVLSNDEGESLRLSKADVLQLAQSARLIADQLQQEHQPRGAVPAFVVPVAELAVGRDSLRTSVHLQMTDEQGNTTRFALSSKLAQFLADMLPAKIADISERGRAS